MNLLEMKTWLQTDCDLDHHGSFLPIVHGIIGIFIHFEYVACRFDPCGVCIDNEIVRNGAPYIPNLHCGLNRRLPGLRLPD